MKSKKKDPKAKSRIVFRMGKRVYLRPVLKEDLPFITISINDPEIHQFLTINRPMSPGTEEKWLLSLDERGSDICFAIVLVETDEMIGLMGLHNVNHIDGTATTGSWIGRKDLWSKGYGTEAKMLVLEYAFNTLNLRKIKSRVYDFNPRSKKCLEKCGYVEEGISKQERYRNGTYVDIHNMAIFKQDFLPLWVSYQKKYLA